MATIVKKILVIDDSTLCYGDLLSHLCHDDTYFKIWRYNTLSDYLVNLIKAIYYNKDIVLLDKDFSDNELKVLGIKSAVIQARIEPDPKLTLDKIQKSLIHSVAKITIFTSGTTGLPKKVTHSISSLSRMIRQDERYNNDIWGLAYNPTHMAGLQVLLQAIFNQNTIINIFKKNSEVIHQLIAKYKITHISSTPTFYRLFVSSPVVHQQVKRITLGGEKFDEQLQNKLASTFPNAKITNIYASTEAGSLLVSRGSYFKIPDNLTDKIRIIDNQLMIHRTLMAANEEVNSDWYATGDLVEYSIENPMFFKFVRRDSELINIGGYKVNPNEVEEVLESMENIHQARVYGKENSVMGKILCADIVSGLPVDIKTLRINLSHQLQDFKIPRVIRRVENIEVTRTGKVKRTL